MTRPPVLISKSWKPPRKGDPAQLLHAQPPTCNAVLDRDLFEADDAMDQAVKLEAPLGRRSVIEQQDRAHPPDEVLFQGQEIHAGSGATHAP